MTKYFEEKMQNFFVFIRKTIFLQQKHLTYCGKIHPQWRVAYML